jgi:CheY-like chemotaxis protein
VAEILLVDDRRFVAEAYRQLLDTAGHSTTVVTDPAEVDTAAHEVTPDLALVDLSFPDHDRNGLDVLLALHDTAPRVKLGILTQADAPFQDLLRCAWDALPLAGALSKDMLPPDFRRAVGEILAGSVVVDPLIRLYLPAQRRSERSLDAYDRLIGHAGHAELWLALAHAEDPPDYAQLSGQLGKKHNTIKNYRDDLATYLTAFGPDLGSSLVELHRFARTARPLLVRAARPYLRLGGRRR